MFSSSKRYALHIEGWENDHSPCSSYALLASWRVFSTSSSSACPSTDHHQSRLPLLIWSSKNSWNSFISILQMSKRKGCSLLQLLFRLLLLHSGSQDALQLVIEEIGRKSRHGFRWSNRLHHFVYIELFWSIRIVTEGNHSPF